MASCSFCGNWSIASRSAFSCSWSSNCLEGSAKRSVPPSQSSPASRAESAEESDERGIQFFRFRVRISFRARFRVMVEIQPEKDRKTRNWSRLCLDPRFFKRSKPDPVLIVGKGQIQNRIFPLKRLNPDTVLYLEKGRIRIFILENVESRSSS